MQSGLQGPKLALVSRANCGIDGHQVVGRGQGGYLFAINSKLTICATITVSPFCNDKGRECCKATGKRAFAYQPWSAD